MKKIILIIVMCVISSNVYAQRAFLGQTTIDRFYVRSNGSTFVGLDRNLPKNACSFFTYHFTFDSTTEAGKNMLSVVMAAQISKSVVNVWYFHTTAEEGSDHKSGCNENKMSVLDAVGLRSS